MEKKSRLIPEPYRTQLIQAAGEGDAARIDEIRSMAASEYPHLFVSEDEEAEIAARLGVKYKRRSICGPHEGDAK